MTKLLVGAFPSNYIGKIVTGHNCDFNYEDTNLTRYHLCVIDSETGGREEHLLWTTHGESHSGWCTASWGNHKVVPVGSDWSSFPTYQCEPVEFTIKEVDDDTLSFFGGNELVAKVEHDGGDHYYPSGFAVFIKNSPIWS
jgi:hypothetical protein